MSSPKVTFQTLLKNPCAVGIRRHNEAGKPNGTHPTQYSMFDLESNFSPLLSGSAHMKTMCWIFRSFLSPAWMLELFQFFYHKTFSFGKDEICLSLMLQWFQWLLWIKACLKARWVCKKPEVCPKKLTISYYFWKKEHTMTLLGITYHHYTRNCGCLKWRKFW